MRLRGCNEMHIIETRNLSYTYHDGTRALSDVNFIAGRGELIAVLGANGAGKSTLFKHLNGILTPTEGEVLVRGEKISKKNIVEVRRTIGLVFQNPDDQIFAPTVRQDVAFGPMNLGLSPDVIEHRVEESLELVGMHGYENKTPHHLSQGEKKRVAIAGVLAMEPQVMVLDEPTAGLDPDGVEKIIDLLIALNEEFHMTVIVATHDVDLVPEFAKRVCVMADGQVVADDEADRVFADMSLLHGADLRPPRITQLLQRLHERGVPVDGRALTIEDAEEKLLRAYRGQ